MKKQNSIKKPKAIRIILIFLTCYFILLSFGLLLENLKLQEEKDYYKNQMISMSEITHIEYNLLQIFMPEEEFSQFLNIKEEPCEHWVLSWDK